MSRPTLLTDTENLWQGVLSRDAQLDGSFVYAVRSTGIYCKPSCAARRPRREQVAFFSTCDEAEAQGFRPCRRCQPRLALSFDERAAIIQRACSLIDANPNPPPTLKSLSQQLHLSPSHLQRLFKTGTGMTLRQYAASKRLGMTPAAYRRGGKGMTIYYSITDTRLGRMLVAATQRGVCAVSFGDEDASLIAALRAEYPAASLQADDHLLATWVHALVAHLEGVQRRLELPLDLRATAFQMRVWEELRKIPYGETRTYREVALSIGQPKAARAVAHACAANPISVVIPCHRVVRSDGSLGGYRWGLERKRALLKQEKGASSSLF